MMYSSFQSITDTRIWQRFHELLLVLMIMFGLIGSYSLLLFIYDLEWQPIKKAPDLGNALAISISDILYFGQSWSLLLSLITTPIAIVCVATNNRLSLPIRLLATAENVNKFVFAFAWALTYICPRKLEFGLFRCPKRVAATFDDILTIVDDYDFLDIAQYCQCLISLSRFLALTFNGTYFRYTLRWPWIQLLIPYLLGVGITHFCFFWEKTFHYDPKWDLQTPPYFFMCALDFVTNRNLTKLKRHGKASRTETLLMYQMLANSFLNLSNTIFYLIIAILLHAFFGPNVEWLLGDVLDFNQMFLFNLVASIISIICLRKPCAKKKRPNSQHITVTSIGPKTRIH